MSKNNVFRLKEIRLECGLKRSKVAEDLQINAGTIANYENGIREAPYEYLIKFAEYFDVSVDYLLGRTDDERPFRHETEENAEESRILSAYRRLSKTAKSRVSEYIDLWQDKN